MSKCYKCGTEFTLRGEEVKCDSCGNTVNFPCWKCKEWFSIFDMEKQKKLSSCKICGYFKCPNCNTTHGQDCQTLDWETKIREILGEDSPLETKVSKIVKFIIKIKTGNESKWCHHKVYKSYAKDKNKKMYSKMQGYRCKNPGDIEIFKKRLEVINNLPLGQIFTLEAIREDGFNGEEYRIVLNVAICSGLIKRTMTERIIDNKKVKYSAFQRVNKGQCKYFSPSELVVKHCGKCKTSYSPKLNHEYCPNPKCVFKKGKNKGNSKKLITKPSTKDICMLERTKFTSGDTYYEETLSE